MNPVLYAQNAWATPAGQIWLIVLLVAAVLALLSLFRPFRQLVLERLGSIVGNARYRDPAAQFDLAIANLEKTWQQVNDIAARASGEVERLKADKIRLEASVIQTRQQASYLKRAAAGKTGADLERAEQDALDRVEQLIALQAELDFIVGDAAKGIPSALDAAVNMEKQASQRKADAEREIKKLQNEKKQAVTQYKTAKAQLELHKRLSQYGADSDRSNLDKLQERIQEDASKAVGMGKQYDSRLDIRSGRADATAQKQAAKDLLNSL